MIIPFLISPLAAAGVAIAGEKVVKAGAAIVGEKIRKEKEYKETLKEAMKGAEAYDENDSWAAFEKEFMTIERLGRAQMLCLCDLLDYVEVIQKVRDFPGEGYDIRKRCIEEFTGNVCKDKIVIEQTKIGDAGRFALKGPFLGVYMGYKIGDSYGQTIFEKAKKDRDDEIGNMLCLLKKRYEDKVRCQVWAEWTTDRISATIYDEIMEYAKKLEIMLLDLLDRGQKDFLVIQKLPDHIDWENLGINKKVSYKKLYAIAAVITDMSVIELVDTSIYSKEDRIVLNKTKMKNLFDDIEKLKKYLDCIDESDTSAEGDENDFRLMVDEDGNVSFHYYENGTWQELPDADDLSQMCHGTMYHDNIKAISQYIKDTYNDYSAFRFICKEKEFELFLDNYDGEHHKIIHRN